MCLKRKFKDENGVKKDNKKNPITIKYLLRFYLYKEMLKKKGYDLKNRMSIKHEICPYTIMPPFNVTITKRHCYLLYKKKKSKGGRHFFYFDSGNLYDPFFLYLALLS